jgi:hypothetical protein
VVTTSKEGGGMTTTPVTSVAMVTRPLRAAIVGGSIGFAVILLAVWLLAAANGVAALPAFGVAVFVAGWGGFGFGAMLTAAVMVASR